MFNYAKKTVSSILMLALILTSMLFVNQPIQAAEISEAGQQQFINTIQPYAVSVGEANNLFPSIMMAQAILESDWGRSKLASPPNYNLFGIKGAGKDFLTFEDDGLGTYFQITDSFKVYGSYQESFQDYARLFSSTPKLASFYASYRSASTVEEAARALTGTYATDTRYGDKLLKIIRLYGLKQYDGNLDRGAGWEYTESNDTVYVTADRVRVRTQPSVGSEIIMEANTGMNFQRKGTSAGWSHIGLPTGGEGYIYSEFVTTNLGEIENGEGEFDVDKFISNMSPEQVQKIEDEALEQEKSKPQSDDQMSDEERAQLKQEVDGIIQQGPSQAANKDALIDSRTALEQASNVDKSGLEDYLESTLNKPFVSSETKEEYKKTVEKAFAIFTDPKATQEQVDEIIAAFENLKTSAAVERETGKQVSAMQQRIKRAKNVPVKIFYDEQSLSKFPVIKATANTGKVENLSIQAFLDQTANRWIEYDIKIEHSKREIKRAKQPIEMHLGIDNTYNMGHLKLYRLNGKSHMEEQQFEVVQDQGETYLEVSTDMFGKYLLVEENLSQEFLNNQGDIYAADINPQQFRRINGPVVDTTIEISALVFLTVAYKVVKYFKRNRFGEK